MADPIILDVGGVVTRATFFKVLSYDEKGRPSTVEACYEGPTDDEGVEYIRAYCPISHIASRPGLASSSSKP